MIFQLLQSGAMSLIDGNNTVYQGSNNATTLFVIANVAPPTGLQIAFTYPDGTVSDTAAPMYLEGDGAIEGTNGYVWSYKLPYRVTEVEGTVGVSINVVNNRTTYINNQTTYTATIEVVYSALPAPQAEYSQTDWQQVLDLLTNYYSWVQTMGDRTKLTTADKTTLVAAINEINALTNQNTQGIDGLNTALAEEIKNRLTAETDLQLNISAEERRRTLGDYALQVDINNERSARESHDVTLQLNIDNEVAARKSADTTLRGDVNSQNNRLSGVELIVGNTNISAVAPDVTRAIVSLNDDVDSLQNGLVPRLNRGIIDFANPTTVPSASLILALNAFINSQLDRAPNNTDKVTVRDSEGFDEGTFYTYNYWTGFTEITDGWYWDSVSITTPITETPSYTQNILLTSWGTAQADGYYHISIPATIHGQGADTTPLVDLKAVDSDGNYGSIVGLYDISTTGTIDIFTDEPFVGIVIVRSGSSAFLNTLTVEIEQVTGLSEVLDDIAVAAVDALSKPLTLGIKTNLPQINIEPYVGLDTLIPTAPLNRGPITGDALTAILIGSDSRPLVKGRKWLASGVITTTDNSNYSFLNIGQVTELTGFVKRKTITNASTNIAVSGTAPTITITVTDADVTVNTEVRLATKDAATYTYMSGALVNNIITEADGSFSFEVNAALPATYSMYYTITEVR